MNKIFSFVFLLSFSSSKRCWANAPRRNSSALEPITEEQLNDLQGEEMYLGTLDLRGNKVDAKRGYSKKKEKIEREALPQPNIICWRLVFIIILMVTGLFNLCFPKSLPFYAMTLINNSSAVKFLALFCIPALLLASGLFDVSTSVMV